jgi:hypothetical protein
MATSSRQKALFGINDWRAIYQTFSEADFRSFDYETLRKSFIDYLRLYYPETFTDYIESSEFIALMDVIAFMGQGLAFRNDLNTRENFIDTAERRDSVVKLANLVSYTPKRNLASQGYLKIVSIKTTQNITDLNGLNLSNIPILWNDPANTNWLEQYTTIVNAALINSQRVGRPGNSAEILSIKTDEYSLSIPPDSLPIVPFNSTVDGIAMGFELVSVTSLDEDYVYELPPEPTGKFNILYRNDKLGYGSPDTGFFFYFKQGSLQNFDFTIEQQISNQVIDIDIQGINNTDTWLYKVNDSNSTFDLWRKVENVYSDAYLQTTKEDRTIFSVGSRFNDQVSYIFGDGVFSEIPVGTFRAYVRGGNALTYTIEPAEMQGITASITYVNRQGRPEVLTLGLELQVPVSNAQAREPLAQIKQRAPTRYYTQNRMVNGEDYNNFPYTLYSSIIKSKAVNRSSIGVSKNLDLLDPTGKYSSTNTFGNDGALYQTNSDGFLNLNIINDSVIRRFLFGPLAEVLGKIRANQYYIQTYPRYNIEGNLFWNLSTVDANSITGYFYNDANIAVATGTFSTNNLKYISKGALILLQAPTGYYFDNDNRLVSGVPTLENPTQVWTTVLNVVGDGYNYGDGNFVNGTGPVVLNGFIPQGVKILTVIPVFDNSLSNQVIDECVIRMELQQNFSLVFDNSLAINQDRWSIQLYDNTNWFVRFLSLGNNRYSIAYKSLAYFYGSVSDNRFAFDVNKLVYDPFSGKQLQDYVAVLPVNTQPNSNICLGNQVKLTIVDQPVQSDGYINSFEVEVSSVNLNNSSVIDDPDFFKKITGYEYGSANIGIYAFFEIIQDAVSLTREQLISTSEVVYSYANKNSIEVVKYEYPIGQLFYAYSENIFYTTVEDPQSITPLYQLVVQPQFLMKPGRQGLKFQYKHNSNNTNRIDPATTNIIDLYVVTQAYYTAYQNWIQDTTNNVPEPDKPTINQLSQSYGELQNYKMLTDSVILNSVIFKPLFGPKAVPALRATIKVIKTGKTNASNSEIRSAVLTAMNSYFNINNWTFGDTFYFSELSAYLHSVVGELVSSIVLVSNDPTKPFGDLYEVKCAPYEIFANAATADDIQVIAALTPNELNQ